MPLTQPARQRLAETASTIHPASARNADEIEADLLRHLSGTNAAEAMEALKRASVKVLCQGFRARRQRAHDFAIEVQDGVAAFLEDKAAAEAAEYDQKGTS